MRKTITRTTNVRPVPLVVGVVAAVLLAACGSTDPAGQGSTDSTGVIGATGAAGASVAADPAGAGSSADTAASAVAGSGEASAAGFPITVQNCGVEVTLDSPPQKILAIKSTSLELLLALGVGDRVIGKAFQDGPVPEQWAAAAEQIPLISEQAPAQEPVLELGPDLIVAGWESNLAADTAGTRDSLAAKEIASYVSPAACQGEHQPPKLTYPLLFDEFAEIGDLLGVPDAAADLIAEQTEQLGTVSTAPEGTTALWWSSGNDTPYVGGGIGAPQMVMEAVGLQNVAADQQQTWTSLGWEAIIEANPDVIVLVDASWNPADKKIKALQDNPATARLDAVVNQRFVTIPFPAAEAGVRSVQAAVDIGDQLQELDLG